MESYFAQYVNGNVFILECGRGKHALRILCNLREIWKYLAN